MTFDYHMLSNIWLPTKHWIKMNFFDEYIEVWKGILNTHFKNIILSRKGDKGVG